MLVWEKHGARLVLDLNGGWRKIKRSTSPSYQSRSSFKMWKIKRSTLIFVCCPAKDPFFNFGVVVFCTCWLGRNMYWVLI